VTVDLFANTALQAANAIVLDALEGSRIGG
jgi:hypothetical protein